MLVDKLFVVWFNFLKKVSGEVISWWRGRVEGKVVCWERGEYEIVVLEKSIVNILGKCYRSVDWVFIGGLWYGILNKNC